MSYVIKDGTGATQTVEADTVGGAIQPVSSPVDANGNHVATAPGVANPNAALAIQGVAGGVPAPVTFSSLQTISITAAQLPTVVAQGSATSGQSGGLEMGAVSTSAPSYANGQTSPLSLTLAGALRVDGSGVTSPINFAQYAGNIVISGGQAGLMAIGGGAASGTSNSGVNPVKVGGVFNTTQPTISNGQVVDAQYTPRGATIVAIGVEGFSPTIAQQPTGDALAASAAVAGGNLLFNGSTWDRQRSAAGTMGVASVNTEGVKATYTANAIFAITANGDVMVMQGSATKVIRILRVEISGTLNTASICLVALVKRSSAGTGGTIGTIDFGNPAPLDSNDIASTAAWTVYTAPPTPGTVISVQRRGSMTFPTTSAAAISPWVTDFSVPQQAA